MLRSQRTVRALFVAGVVVVAGCADDRTVATVDAPTTTVAAGAAGASMAPSCLPHSGFRSLTEPTVTMEAGETVDLGVEFPETTDRLTVETFELGFVLEGSERPVRTMVVEDQRVPGEIRVTFDGLDDDGRRLGPGRYHVDATVQLVGDGPGRCPELGSEPGRETISGELVVVEIRA